MKSKQPTVRRGRYGISAIEETIRCVDALRDRFPDEIVLKVRLNDLQSELFRLHHEINHPLQAVA